MGRDFRPRAAAALAGVSLATVFASPVSASPWPQPQGDTLVITRAESFSSDTFRQVSTSAYVEHGLTDELTLGGKAIYSAQDYGGDFPAAATGFSAAEVFLQWQMFRTDRTVYSARVTYGVPTKLTRQAFAENIRFNDLRYGDAMEAAFLVGHSLNADGTVFVAAETGYRRAFSDDADLVRADFVAGFKRDDRWLVMLKSFNSVSIDNAVAPGAAYDLYRIEPTISYRRKNGQAYTIGAVYDLGGSNLETGTGVFLSFWNRY